MSKITNLSKYVGWVLRDPDVTDGPMWLVAAGHKGRCTVIEVNTGIRFTDGCLQSVFQRSDRALLWRNIAPGSRLTIAGHDVTVMALNTDVKVPQMNVAVGPWEFPGGKVEPHESLQQALNRELCEELGIRVRGPSRLLVVHEGPTFVVHVFEVNDWEGTPQGLEGQPVQWSSRVAG